MKKWIFILLFVLAIVLSACSENSKKSESDNVDKAPVESKDTNSDSAEGNKVDTEKAEEVFQNNCALCHGSDLTGGAGPNLTEVGSRYSKEEITEIINNGKNNGRMPAEVVTGDNVDLIASWLAQRK